MATTYNKGQGEKTDEDLKLLVKELLPNFYGLNFYEAERVINLLKIELSWKAIINNH